MDLFLAKKCNESDIVTIDTSESTANASALEEPKHDDVGAAFPMGFLDEDLYHQDMNLSKVEDDAGAKL